MDYNKVNKINTDGNNNIVLQDVNGSTITVNYNDAESLKNLFEQISDKQTFDLKQAIANENKEVLSEIRKIQQQIDEQNTDTKITEYTADLDNFFKELTEMKLKSAKERLLKNYSLLHEYEDLLILEDDPKRKMRYEKEIETIKNTILRNETELKSIAKN